MTYSIKNDLILILQYIEAIIFVHMQSEFTLCFILLTLEAKFAEE